MKEVHDRHKSHVDLKRREIEFHVGDKATMVKVVLYRHVIRFDSKGKLALR